MSDAPARAALEALAAAHYRLQEGTDRFSRTIARLDFRSCLDSSITALTAELNAAADAVAVTARAVVRARNTHI